MVFGYVILIRVTIFKPGPAQSLLYDSGSIYSERSLISIQEHGRGGSIRANPLRKQAPHTCHLPIWRMDERLPICGYNADNVGSKEQSSIVTPHCFLPFQSPLNYSYIDVSIPTANLVRCTAY
jgi:hypothetical protein